MNYAKILFLLAVTGCCQAQANLIVGKKLIADWSKYPIYPRLAEDAGSASKWKKEYAYLDSIEVYSLTYLSDGLKIKGYMAKPKKPGKYPCIIFNRGGNRE